MTLEDQTVLATAQSDLSSLIRGLDQAIIDEIQRARSSTGHYKGG